MESAVLDVMVIVCEEIPPVRVDVSNIEARMAAFLISQGVEAARALLPSHLFYTETLAGKVPIHHILAAYLHPCQEMRAGPVQPPSCFQTQQGSP